jgi:ankyrin repeat protein
VLLKKQLVDDEQLDINFAGVHPPGLQYIGTPLMQDACLDNIYCFVYLLQHGARLDVREGMRLSTLETAAAFGSLKVVQYLLATQFKRLATIDNSHG